jgi:large subunit ribosomal protein L30
MVYAVIRIRGTVNVKPNINKTLQLLNLTRSNHCILLNESKSTKGMLQIAKDYVTWGEIQKGTIERLLKERGRINGNKPLTDKHVQSATSYKNINELSEAVFNEKIRINEIPDLKKVFRLHPPRKGLEGIKRSYANKGALGYRGKSIENLLKRMM